MKRQSWTMQLFTIQNKGYQAGLDGQPKDANPYESGHRNQNGLGGSLQSQCRQAWRDGWMIGVDERNQRLTDAERQLYGALQAFDKKVAV